LRQDDLAELDHVAATLGARGFDAARLDRAEIHELEPHLSPRVLGGLLLSGDHQVDPRALARALERSAVAAGAIVAAGRTVESIAAEAGRVRHVRGRGPEAEAFTIEAERVVLAAGAWSERGLCLPIPELGLRPVKGQLVRLHGARLLRHVVPAPGAYLVPRANGELLVGATMEEMGFDDTPTAGAVMDLLWRAFEALPGAYELRLSEVSVGLRPAVADHLPVIGESEVAGLYLAVGHHRDGVLLAPATAHHLVDWMLEGARPEALAPFGVERLAGEGVR
jgi:glycine oxidase